MADNFVMEQLMKIVKDLSSLNTEVEKSFRVFQNSLVNIEKLISVLKNSSHQHEHQISKLLTDVEELKKSYVISKTNMEQHITTIESKLKGYVNKPNWKKIIITGGAIGAAIGGVATFISNLSTIKAFFIKFFGG